MISLPLYLIIIMGILSLISLIIFGTVLFAFIYNSRKFDETEFNDLDQETAIKGMEDIII